MIRIVMRAGKLYLVEGEIKRYLGKCNRPDVVRRWCERQGIAFDLGAFCAARSGLSTTAEAVLRRLERQ